MRLTRITEAALRRELLRLEKKLEGLRERIEKLSPLPVYWKKVSCGKPCRTCSRGPAHGPYPYLKVKREGRWRWTYLGKSWQPPEGWVRPRAFRKALAEYHKVLKQREAVLKMLEEGYNGDR